MTIQRRIRYRVIDEEGLQTFGVHIGVEDVRQFLEILNKRFRDAQMIHLEFESEFDDGQLTEEEMGLLADLD